jgi:argininosuccinate synthase
MCEMRVALAAEIHAIKTDIAHRSHLCEHLQRKTEQQDARIATLEADLAELRAEAQYVSCKLREGSPTSVVLQLAYRLERALRGKGE